MTRVAHRRSLAAIGLIVLGGAGLLRAREDDSRPTAAQLEFFEKEVRPLLASRCYKCHAADAKRVRGNLLLDTREGVLKGGDLGPVVVPGTPDESLLIQAVRYDDPDLQMPPDRRLSRREVEALEEWVRMGVPITGAAPRAAAAGPGPATDEARRWWAFQPVRDPAVPTVGDAAWSRNAVDRFVLARLEAAGVRPAPEADRRTLIRRVTFDLTGLPPTPEEVEAFVNDAAPDAYEWVVDRLLASPHHGERWGRHWLDVARYADTSGCNSDFPMPEAYRYRNYVIDSFNRDKPYDRFLREQVAGDLLPADSEEQRYEQTIATGYLAISRRFSSVAEEFHLTLDDAIDNLGKAVLGLTVSCARCHDHKFDPIPQRDYYALYGIFGSTRFAFPGTEIYRHVQDLVPLVPADRKDGELRAYLERMAALDAEISRTYSPIETLDTGKEKDAIREKVKALQGERDELIKTSPAYEKAYAVSEGTPADARIQIKGDPEKLGPQVPRGFLQVLGGGVVSPGDAGSGRKQLADWLADPANPLTARVMVNRVWQGHFGRGLVRSPGDFGTRGEPPTHPELLDWLTTRFIEGAWSIKALHRLVALSATYRMASVEDIDKVWRDPENRLIWTFDRRRLDAEEIRDAMLAVAGMLDCSQGGAHPFPPEWEWRYTQHKPFVDDYPSLRRGVYLMQQRFRSQPFLGTFDGADTNAPTARRTTSTTPQQALFALNNEFVHEHSTRLAARLATEAATPSERIERAFLLAFGRPPGEEEVREGLDYLDRIDAPLRAAGVPDAERSRTAWASYLRVVLGSNEFVFVD